MSEQDDSKRIVISNDDLSTDAINQRVEALRAASVPQTVRPIGAPQPASTSAKWWLGGTSSTTLAGLSGGFAGFIISEIIAAPDDPRAPFANDPGMATAFWMVLFSLGLAAVMASWEGLQLRSGDKTMRSLAIALPVVGVAGFLGGYLVQTAIYEPMVTSAIDRAVLTAGSDAEFFSVVMNGIRIARTIGFAVMGGILGVSLGAATRSGKRAVNGLIGGTIGGLVGGFLFDFIGEAMQSGAPSRAVAMILTGSLTGLAIGLVEQLRKDHWLEIVTGGMAGKQFILYHDRTEVGAAPSCHVTLIKDPAIPPVAMTLTTQGEHLVLEPIAGAPVSINGQAATRRPLVDGDVVQVGSTVLRYGQRAQAMPRMATA